MQPSQSASCTLTRTSQNTSTYEDKVNDGISSDSRIIDLSINSNSSSGSSGSSIARDREVMQVGGGGGECGNGVPSIEIRAPGERFDIIEESEQYVRRFRVTGRRFVLRIREPPSERTNPIVWLEEVIRDIHAYIASLATSETDLVGVSIDSSYFTHGSGGMSLRPIDSFFYHDLWNLISSICQSNDSFQIDNSFLLKVTFIEMPVGSGARRKKNLTIDVVRQRSIIRIDNDNDNLCLPRALVVGEAHIICKNYDSYETRKIWKDIRDGRRKLQKEKAENLVRESGIIIPTRGCGFYELKKFQEYYTTRGLAIVVFDKETFGSGNAPFFDGRRFVESIELHGTINLLYDSNLHHFDTILNLVGVAQSKFFCSFCNKRYHHIDQHQCKKICPSCFVSPACQDKNIEIIKCNSCNRNFFGISCFENHKKIGIYKKNEKILCDLLKICTSCFKLIHTHRGKHECGVNWCQFCKERHDVNRLCYMQPIRSSSDGEKSARKKKYLFIFYDFETRQDVAYRNHRTTKIHIPNLCVAQQICSDCLDSDDVTQWCHTCGIREYIFCDEPVKQLTDFSIREKSDFEQIICIAHNAGGFDAQFILKELTERSSLVLPSVILNGQNIIMLQLGRTKFIDSLNYFHMKLSELPKAFDLPSSNKKGYFPHLFNTLENQEYVGELPEAKFYAPDSMSASERETFFAWYNECLANRYVFDFKKEIVEYCRMDVEILRRACMAFRKIFLAVGNTDPFVCATTIASACSHVFRKNFLKPYTIGIIPPNGYRRADRHSQRSIEWLLQCEREIGREIIHAARSREFRLPEGFLVDGYLLPREEKDRGIVYEYQGCYTHGCPRCFKNNRDNINSYGRSFAEAYESTCAKIAKIKSLGYEVREIWECEFEKIKSENPDIARYLSNHPLINKTVLNPRDAFYGGRTENIVTRYKIKKGEKIKYTDICSLYPYVCKRGRFPVGHPRIFVDTQCDELTGGRNDDLSRVEGLIKCKVLPPRNLFLPLLPVKMHNRLLFALCRSCCEEMRQYDCNHEEIHEREFTGTWVVDEVRKAIELGYRITKIYVIWQYKMTQFEPSTGEGGLFADYVNTFLKIKQQASGWPSWCTDDATKAKYIHDYERDEGIQLESEKIEKNAGLRAVAKLCLNSFWGKFGQRSNLKQTEIIKTREALLELLVNPEKVVFDVLAVNDEVLYANWHYKEDAVEPAPHTNVVIAAYTTTQARLKLYTYLEKLERRILYYDTDSCIYVCNESNENEYDPPLGSLLGDMTDELKSYGPNAYIETFLSGGPKFYGFRAVISSSGETVECCKVKGISLNFSNSLKINFNSIEKLINNTFATLHNIISDDDDDDNDDDDENDDVERENTIKINYKAIRRMPTHDVVTRDEFKTCCVVLKKRRYLSQNTSVPFGYKHE